MKREDLPPPCFPDRFPKTEEERLDDLYEDLMTQTPGVCECLLLEDHSAMTLNFEQQFRVRLARCIDTKDPAAYESLGRLIAERNIWAWLECNP